MNISSISSQSAIPFQPGAEGPFKQRREDFKALQTALESGNLDDAKTAFAALQKDDPKAAQAAPSTDSQDPLSKDFQTLSDALKSGDVSAAQQAFATLKQDLKATRGAHGHQHHAPENDDSAGTIIASASTAAPSSDSAGTLLNTLA